MASIKELLAECNLSDPQTSGQEKVATAAKPSTDEIDRVLENLGLKEDGQEKTASATETDGGNDMSLANIYNQLFDTQEVETAVETEKVASEVETNEESSEVSATTAFGELTGEYFNIIAAPFFSKVAGELEMEAGKGEKPLAHQPKAEGDAHLPVNHKASGGEGLKAMTHGESPYSLKEKALAKAILKRMMAAPVGAIKE
jgi:hypothetical protein